MLQKSRKSTAKITLPWDVSKNSADFRKREVGTAENICAGRRNISCSGLNDYIKARYSVVSTSLSSMGAEEITSSPSSEIVTALPAAAMTSAGIT